MRHKVGIKFCGLSSGDAVEAANRLRVHLAGFVFFEDSPRHVSAEQAAALAARLQEDILPVVVMVDPDDAMLAEYLAVFRPEFVQLHGEETPERVAEVKQKHGVRVIKAVGVKDSADLWAVSRFREVADLLLLDAKAPKGALPGGRGEAFDWALLEGLKMPPNWILSGGLNAGNVAEAVRMTKAPQVDVSSGIESAPGVKDPVKMEAFVEALQTL